MRVIGVIDIKSGQAVQAIAGNRADYQPVKSVLTTSSDPAVVLVTMLQMLPSREVYIADLDLIMQTGQPHGMRAITHIIRQQQAAAHAIWLDAGYRTVDDVLLDQSAGVRQFVIGTETWRGPAELKRLLAEVDPAQLILSLDMKAGKLLLPNRVGELHADGNDRWRDDNPMSLIADATAMGITRVLLLDLACVGTSTKFSRAFIAQVKRTQPTFSDLLIGGGVVDQVDLRRLAEFGVTGALVATALHRGTLPISSLVAPTF